MRSVIEFSQAGEIKENAMVCCDRKISVKLKGKVYKTKIRSVMLYAAETWATKEIDKRLEIQEMRMLRWMNGMTRRDSGK